MDPHFPCVFFVRETNSEKKAFWAGELCTVYPDELPPHISHGFVCPFCLAGDFAFRYGWSPLSTGFVPRLCVSRGVCFAEVDDSENNFMKMC